MAAGQQMVQDVYHSQNDCPCGSLGAPIGPTAAVVKSAGWGLTLVRGMVSEEARWEPA